MSNKYRLAQSAASAVVDTLTWKDTLSVVSFDGAVRAVYGGGKMVPMTDANKVVAKAWIKSNIQAYGGTAFTAPLLRAMDILIAHKKRCGTGCSNTVLFMTDGAAAMTPADYESILAKSKKAQAVIFGYALGSGANVEHPKAMACMTDGMFYRVASTAALGNAMSSYYSYATMKKKSRDIFSRGSFS